MAQDMRDDRGMAGVPAYDRGSYDKEYSDEHIEKGHAHAHDTDRRGSAVEEDFDPEMVKRVKRKIDARLTPVLAIMYIINQIDRSNLGNAVIAGMAEPKEDGGLNLIGARYSIIVLVFFPTYFMFNFVGTVLCRKIGPRPFLSGITLSFGLISLGIGLVDNWGAAAGLRVLLGAFESCFFPAALFLISMYYVRREVAKRNAIFYLLGSSVGGFGGVLAYGLQQMDGLGGHEGWRWIFLMEGIVTVAIAITAYIFLADFPEEAHKTKKFLNAEEIQLVIDRVDRDRSDAHITPFTLKIYLSQARDWKVWMFATNFGAAATVSYAVSYFLPLILRESLEFSVVKAQCLTAPCFAFALVFGYTQAVISDKYNWRGHFVVFNCLVQITGVAILGFAGPPYVRYFGAFLVTGGCNANVAASATYMGNNVVGQWKRAFSNALMVAFGALGGIIGTTTFRSQDAPQYLPGLITVFLVAGITICSVIITTLYMMRQNKRAAKGEIIIEGVPGFRYTL